MGRAFEEIVRRLNARGYGPRRVGGRVEAFCTVHDDRGRPNLSVGDQTAGKATVYCWCCQDRSVDWLRRCMGALGLDVRHVYDDAWQPRRRPRPRSPPATIGDLGPVDELPDHHWVRSASEVYRYRRRIDGPVVAACLVWPGKRRAMVRPSRHGLVAGIHGGVYGWDPRHHVWRRGRGSPTRTFPTTRLPFYRGEHVIPRLDTIDGPVLWCAGQKDADTAAKLGFPALAHPGGEGACRPDLAQQLAGHDVVIIFDHDETGRSMGPKVAERLRSLGVRASVLDPRRLAETVTDPPRGFDLTDWARSQRAG